MVIDPEVIPSSSNDGMNATSLPSDLITPILLLLVVFIFAVVLKYIFQALLIFLGIRFIWSLANS